MLPASDGGHGFSSCLRPDSLSETSKWEEATQVVPCPTMPKPVTRTVSALAARTVHAAVEGCAFVWTTEGFRTLLIVHSLALMWALGPRRTVSLGLQCGLACSFGKFAIVLTSNHLKRDEDEETLESIWDFTPPGEIGESGAWKVMKELALTMSSGAEAMPELQGFEPLPVHELAVRLCFMYQHRQEHPVVDSLAQEDILGPVDPESIDLLCKYLYFADQAYDCGTEANLKRLLGDYGYELNFAKLEATWAEHEPAYFVATHPEQKELLITVRGTAQIEDVVTDLTAMPKELENTGHLVHGGMYASAVWLRDRLLSLAQAMEDAGFRITLIGHSLGAGTMALLSLMFRHRGLSSVQCYAFATPNCADIALAHECQDYVTSVVFRDDIVTRFSPEAIILLHDELQDFDLDAALKKAKEDGSMMLSFVSTLGRVIAAGDALNKGGESSKALDSKPPLAVNGKNVHPGYAKTEEEAEAGGSSAIASDGDAQENTSGHVKVADDQEPGRTASDSEARSYRPHIPGRVLYIYRGVEAGGEAEEDESDEPRMAFVRPECSALRCIRLSDKVITDHLTNSYFAGFGRENPAKAEKQKEAGTQEGVSKGDGDPKGEKEERREQTANERDKEEKDRIRSWMGKLGLAG